jgi:uncharacterized protein YcsI (UPF0317 family)
VALLGRFLRFPQGGLADEVSPDRLDLDGARPARAVSMRPIPEAQLNLVGELSARYPHAHGAPIHIGAPKAIGIADLGRPDYGDPVAIHPNEVPVFWACRVTPQAVALQARPDLMITHEPGIMFLTELPREGDIRS